MGTTIEAFYLPKGSSEPLITGRLDLKAGENHTIKEVYTGGAPGIRLESITVFNLDNLQTIIFSESGTEILKWDDHVYFPAKSKIEIGQTGFKISNTISKTVA